MTAHPGRFVLGTGRCGSTLLHKAVSAMGTASFSEPHWLDQLLFNPSLEPASVERALRVCVCLDARTARLQTAVPGWARPTIFVFNPKAGGMKVAAASVAAFPRARAVGVEERKLAVLSEATEHHERARYAA